MKKSYGAWIQFYMEFADKLRHIDRKELIERIKKCMRLLVWAFLRWNAAAM